jgi:hypothetical protein
MAPGGDLLQPLDSCIKLRVSPQISLDVSASMVRGRSSTQRSGRPHENDQSDQHRGREQTETALPDCPLKSCQCVRINRYTTLGIRSPPS